MSALKLIIEIILFILSAIPLHFAVKLLGGKTGLIKTAFISFIVGIVVATINTIFKNWGWLIGFFILIWIYHEMFRLKWIKAFLAWLLQFVFIAIFYMISGLILILFGISLFI